MSDQLAIEMAEDSGVSCLALKGFLDLRTAPELEEAIRKLIQKRKYRIVVDCAELSFISSAGIGVFMGFVDEIREDRRGDIVFCRVRHDKVQETFDLVKFGELFHIAEELDEAMRRFSTDPEPKR